MATIKDIMSLTPDQLVRLTRKQLVEYVRHGERQIERRAKTIEDYEKFSPSVNAYYGGKGIHVFKMRGKTRNALLAQLAKQVSFFQSQTSTLKGVIEFEKEQDERIFGKFSQKSLTQEQRASLWNTYSIMEEDSRFQKYFNELGSSRMQEYLATQVYNGTDDRENFLNEALDELQSLYETERGEEHGPWDGVDIGGNPY